MSDLIVSLKAPEAADPGRFGPKAAGVAALGRAGLPIPDGFCIDAEAYRLQLRWLGLDEVAREVFAADDPVAARRAAVQMKLGLLEEPIAPSIRDLLLAARQRLADETGSLLVVRSSALVEDRYGSSFAGQFESYLGLETEAEYTTA